MIDEKFYDIPKGIKDQSIEWANWMICTTILDPMNQGKKSQTFDRRRLRLLCKKIYNSIGSDLSVTASNDLLDTLLPNLSTDFPKLDFEYSEFDDFIEFKNKITLT